MLLRILTSQNLPSILALILISWSLKLLLIPAYFSTDFDVHQNWLRITHNYPLSQWYYNQQSKWTLDYPPFFAYFQYLLSCIANLFDSNIVNSINKLSNTIIFQRLSVIFTDLLYLYSLLYALKKKKNHSIKISAKLVILYLWIPFIILDNIHFQYNLMMQAILILSIAMINRKRFLVGALLFSILLNFKHIYLYCAPAYAAYLIKEYVLAIKTKDISHKQNINNYQSSQQSIPVSSHYNQSSVLKFIKLSIITLIPFIISFAPFVMAGGVQQIKQILSRLFPFSRGLVHQYWAPNVWALYHFLDKILVLLGMRTHSLYTINTNNTNSIHSAVLNTLKVLPQISPAMTLIIISVILLPIVVIYFFSKKHLSFAHFISLTGLIFFLFGFHVHQKAITPYLNILFIFCPWVTCLNSSIFVNIINLIPLLINPAQKTLSIILCLIWLTLCEHLENTKKQQLLQAQQKVLHHINLQNIYKLLMHSIQYIIQISGMLILIFHILVHPILMMKKNNIQFMAIMLNSVWAACFNVLWVGYIVYRFMWENVSENQITDEEKYYLEGTGRTSHFRKSSNT